MLEYFPIDEASAENYNKTLLYRRRAKARLGEVYLSQSNLNEALEIYSELENSEEFSGQFRVTGSAGKAVVYDLMAPDEFTGGVEEKEQKVRECLGKVGADFDLLNEFLRNAITAIQQRYPATPPPLPDVESEPTQAESTTFLSPRALALRFARR